MKSYKCDVCNKLFKQKSHFANHKNRKFPCKPIIEKDCKNIAINCDIDKLFTFNKETQEKDDVNQNNKCVYCGKLFSQRYNMLAHMRKTCKTKKDIDAEKETIFKQLLKEMRELKQSNKEIKEANNKIIKENKKLRGTIYKLKVNNTTNNNNGTINNYNNIKLVAFGKEKDTLKMLKKSDILKAIEGFGTEIKLTKLIHYNEEHPECHNVYSRNLKDKYAMIYDGTQWKSRLKSEIIEEIYDFNKEYVEENLEQFLDSLDDSKKNSLKRWLSLDDTDDKIKKIKEEIKMLMYNEKDMVQSYALKHLELCSNGN